MKKQRKRSDLLCKSHGFTMVEMLVVIVIMVLVSVMMATGIPAGVNSMRKAVEASHAQALISTAMTALRDELTTAKDLKVVSSGGAAPAGDGGGNPGDAPAAASLPKVTYTDSDGVPTVLEVTESLTSGVNEKKGILLTKVIPKGATTETYTHLLVSAEASTSDLYVAMNGISYTDGVVTISSLEVRKPVKGSTEGEYTVVVRIDSYQIRVVGAGITSTP